MQEEIVLLVKKFQKGDEDAFEEIVGHYQKRVFNLAAKFVGDFSTADELTQTAFIKVYQKISGLRSPKTFESWLYRIVYNVINDHFRQSSREKTVYQDVADMVALQRNGEDSQPVESDFLNKVMEAVNRLPHKHREVFVMREIQDLSNELIASILGIPEGTVWSRLNHARQKLRKMLKGKI